SSSMISIVNTECHVPKTFSDLAKIAAWGRLGLQAPGKFRAFLRRFLEGDRPSPAFADKRLEALRRVSVHAWHRGFAIPEAELDRFLNAGFSEQQFEAVISRIQRSKAQASCCKNGPQPGHVHALA
ncbi:hypothetical protein ACQKE8_19890, partial [Sphingobium limneticum]|uniref:hypothetical protein n=1 Tax=Sphingobium limneticum TaxID=1007511 RepID=UPI003D0189AF